MNALTCYSKMKGPSVPDSADDLKLLAELCDDAVAIHGADIGEIKRHVEGAINRLPSTRQRSLRAALADFVRRQPYLPEPIHSPLARH